ncbi:MAG: DNA repair protein RadA [Oscillospiraceae bacterium]|jgi:DNA repair protein RadA/Sms|nr:DNA repair protein RadA [Oscillospiraceae bacterium]
MANKQKSVYVCSSCGNETPSWEGRCRACGEWNTIGEFRVEPEVKTRGAAAPRRGAAPKASGLGDIGSAEESRFSTGMAELDRVLGGGIVDGSLVLLGGAPGIGKSTLLLQICGTVAKSRRVLYVSGEESARQLKLRADRLAVASDNILVLTETDVAEVLAAADEEQPELMIIDSIQTLYSADSNSAPGSVSQVKDCAMRLMHLAKERGIAVFLIGHINKEGAIAGPIVLEHIVDCVLRFEGERGSSFRILRAQKNRFGSTNELGVFDMSDKGIAEVPNPSEMMLSGRPVNTPGTCVACVLEGTRPLLAEIQALVSLTGAGQVRRNANGLDFNRTLMLIAVLEKRGGARIGGLDVYLNVIGGFEIEEPGADLAAVLAIASSYHDKPIGDDLAAIGEVGLTGELRSVSGLDLRVSEAARLGFRRCIVPSAARGKLAAPRGVELIFAASVSEAVKAALH